MDDTERFIYSDHDVAVLTIDDDGADDGIRVGELTLPDGEVHSIYFQHVGGSLSAETGADPFLMSFLLFAMERAIDIHVASSVGAETLRNIEELQTIWSQWNKRYKKVHVLAPTVRRTSHQNHREIAAFSGGIDATYTLCRGAEERPGRNRIDAVLFIHGFDIDPDDGEGFSKALKIIRPTADERGIDVRLVRTNVRTIPQDWEDFCGLAVGACLALFAPEFATGLIASTDTYRLPILRWGSGPVTDQFYSSEALRVRYDGGERTRVEKLAYLAQVFPEVVPRLRFCWQKSSDGRNCGRCDKCRRSHAQFLAAGAPVSMSFLHVPTLFETVVGAIPSQVDLIEYWRMIQDRNSTLLAPKWRCGLWMAVLVNIVRLGVRRAARSIGRFGMRSSA